MRVTLIRGNMGAYLIAECGNVIRHLGSMVRMYTSQLHLVM